MPCQSCTDSARCDRSGLCQDFKEALPSCWCQAEGSEPHAKCCPRHASRLGAKASIGTAGVAPTVPAGRVLPHPGSSEASAMMDSMLAEYQWPANSKNAARAGWEAANRRLTSGVAPCDGGKQG